MRDLVLVTDVSHGAQALPAAAAQVHIAGVCVDAATGNQYSLSARGGLVAWDAGGKLLWTAQVDVPVEEGAEAPAGGPSDGYWHHIAFLEEQNVLFMVHSGGAMVQRAPSAEVGVELIGAIDAGIEAAAWTADQTVVLIVTSECKLLTLTASTWDVLAEVDCPHPFVTRTQPQPAAAAAPAPALPANCRVFATWRADGAHFALSAVDAGTGMRTLRVFTSDGTHRGAGRNEDGSAVPGLHPGGISWSNDGALIAVGQDVAARNRVQVAFFETNGLRHRELIVPGVTPMPPQTPATAASAAAAASGAVAAPVVGVGASVVWSSWNTESDALAVLLEQRVVRKPAAAAASAAPPCGGAGTAAAGPAFASATALLVLQLWHRDNYKWYLKRQQPVATVSAADAAVAANSTLPPAACAWSTERAHRLHFVASDAACGGARCHTWDLAWRFDCASASRAEDGTAGSSDTSGTVAVIDGGENRVCLTPFAVAGVPPPMAFTTLQLTPATPTGGALAADGDLAVLLQRASAAPAEVSFVPAPTSDSACNPFQSRLMVLTADGSVVYAPVAYTHPRDAAGPAPAAAAARGTAGSSVAAGGIASGMSFSCGVAGDTGRATLQLPLDSADAGAPPVDAATALAPAAVEVAWSAHLPSALPATLPIVTAASASPSSALAAEHVSFASLARASVYGHALRHLHVLDHRIIGAAAESAGASAGDTTGPCASITVAFASSGLVAGAPDAGSSDTATAGTDHIVVAALQAPLRLASATTAAPVCSSALAWRLPAPGLRVVAVATAPAVLALSTSPVASVPAEPIAVDSFVYAHLSDGSIWQLQLRRDSATMLSLASCRLLFRLPEAVTQLRAVHDGTAASNCTPLVIAFGGRSCRLYANGRVISPAASSATVSASQGLLLYVTVGPTPALAAIHLSSLLPRDASGALHLAPVHLADVDRGDGTPGAGSAGVEALHAYQPRLLERGSRLVGVICASPASCSFATTGDGVLLQMPRGNCETIVPRALTLHAIRECLDQRPTPDWATALELCRKHRIDMNMLVDHCPALVTHDHFGLLKAVFDVAATTAAAAVGGIAVHKKAGSLKGTDRWDLLLSALEVGDVTAPAGTRYAPRRAGAGDGGDAAAAEGPDGAASAGGNPLAGKFPPPGYYPGPPAVPSGSAWPIEAAIAAADPSLQRLLAASGAGGHAGMGAAKVNRACAAVRLALFRAMMYPTPLSTKDGVVVLPTADAGIHWRSPLVFSVLTSYARQVPPDLPALLKTVQHVAAAEASGKAAPPGGRLFGPAMSGDAALHHAILVADSDVELLYTTALGMYDVPLAHALAQRGQSDPREYLPLLTRLAAIAKPRAGDEHMGPASTATAAAGAASSSTASAETAAVPTEDTPPSQLSAGALRQRWAIDVQLGRWRKAATWLGHLAARATKHRASLAASVAAPAGDAAPASSKDAKAARMAALLAMAGKKDATAPAPAAGAATSTAAGSEAVAPAAVAVPLPSAADLRTALRSDVDELSATFTALLTPPPAAPSSSSGSATSQLLAATAVDTATSEGIVDAGVLQPLLVLCSIAAQHGAHDEATGALAAASDATTATDGAAATPSLVAECRRLLSVDGAWRSVAGLGAAAKQTPAAQRAEAATGPSVSYASALMSVVPAPGIMALFAHFAPPAVAGTPAAVIAAPQSRVLAALKTLLVACNPPAVDDALALALMVARGSPMDLSAATVAALGRPAATGTPLWRFALSLASLPQCCMRAPATAAAAAGSSPFAGITVRTLAKELAASLLHTTQPMADACLMPSAAVIDPAAMAASAQFGVDSVGDSRALNAAAALLAGPGADTDDAVRTYCSAGSWDAAVAVACDAGRLDLVDTDILPSLAATAGELVAECGRRSTAVLDAFGKLVECRRLRAGMTIADILGASEASRIAARINMVAGLTLASGGDGGDEYGGGAGAAGAASGALDGGGGGWDDGASMSQWSDASSVASGMTGASDNRSRVSAISASLGLGALGFLNADYAGSIASGASGASSGTALTGRTSGRFSHVPASSLPTTITNLRSSLRMSDAELTPSQAVANDAAAAAKFMDRREVRRATGGKAGVADRVERKQRRDATRVLKVRPGSIGEEVELEEELSRLLPTARSAFRAFAAHVAASACRLGRLDLATRVTAAFNGYVQVLTAAVASGALPPPRRNVPAEVAAMLAAAAEARATIPGAPPLPAAATDVAELVQPTVLAAAAARDPVVVLASEALAALAATPFGGVA